MDAKDDPVTLSNWRIAVRLRKQLEEGYRELDKFETKLAKTHREQHPLSPQTIKDIMDIYGNGMSLCCATGRENLKAYNLDECWAEYINCWAYELMGCSGEYRPQGPYHEIGKEQLMKILTGQL